MAGDPLTNRRPSEVGSEDAAAQPPLGHPVPEALHRYYRAIETGRTADAVAAFASDATYAVPRAGTIETDERRIIDGHDELAAFFAERGLVARTHEVQLCLADGSDVLLEGVTRNATTGEAELGFAASVTLDRDGAVRRYLAFGGGPVPDRSPAEDDPAPDSLAATGAYDASMVLTTYFRALDEGRFAVAAGCFGPDVLYVHPPYRHTGIDSPDRVTFRGRPALLAAFEARGAQAFDHRLLRVVQHGAHAMVEGVVEGLPDGRTGSFVSTLSLAADGLISRYVSFYCEPSVAFS